MSNHSVEMTDEQWSEVLAALNAWEERLQLVANPASGSVAQGLSLTRDAKMAVLRSKYHRTRLEDR